MDALKTFIRPLEKKLYHFHVFFFFFRILNIFNTHTRGEGRRFLKNLQWCISKRALYHFHVKYKKGSKS